MLKDSERFYRVYASIPIEERRMPIIINEDGPISWDYAYELINNGTPKGKKILKLLIELEII